jgi:hypothetical protein
VYELDPESNAALEEFCARLTPQQADYLRTVVRRICEDPSGRRHPTHNYTRPFRRRKIQELVGSRPLKVWELKTNRYRALFFVADFEKGSRRYRQLRLIPVGGRRIMFPEECPWH